MSFSSTAPSARSLAASGSGRPARRATGEPAKRREGRSSDGAGAAGVRVEEEADTMLSPLGAGRSGRHPPFGRVLSGTEVWGGKVECMLRGRKVVEKARCGVGLGVVCGDVERGMVGKSGVGTAGGLL